MGFGSTLGQDVVSVGIIDYWTLVIFVCQQRRCVEIISLVLTLTMCAVLAIFLLFPGFYMKLEKVKRNNGRWTRTQQHND
jgi:hypothetical protein